MLVAVLVAVRNKKNHMNRRLMRARIQMSRVQMFVAGADVVPAIKCLCLFFLTLVYKLTVFIGKS